MISEREILDAKILIVDDQPSNARLLERILGGKGYTRINSTTDPSSAVELYLQYKPDLVLLDLIMPDMNGFQFMERLARLERQSYLPILVLTADTSHGTREQALAHGAKDFLIKPFDSIEVLMRIHNILEVRLLYNKMLDQNKLLEEKVRERTRNLMESRLEIINRLSLAAEYRDDVTGLHIKRMSDYCAVLARAAGMTDDEAELMRAASKMHDIGKIKIPDRILLKPGVLDDEEWEVMKSHPVVGAAILSRSDSELLQMAERIALTHHEKWDGTGYPYGLKGDEIPFVGRIAALCDVFDALTTTRGYREAWSIEKAMNDIDSRSGKHFDPALVGLFREIVPEIARIKESYFEPG